MNKISNAVSGQMVEAENIVEVKKSKCKDVFNGLISNLLTDSAISKLELNANPIEIIKLDNGMKVYFLNRKNLTTSGQYAALNLVIKTGFISEYFSRYSDIGLEQLAHFIEHCVFLGTENFTQEDIQKFTKDIGCPIGADLNASTGLEITQYNFDKVSVTDEENFKKTIKILYELAFCATFPESIMNEITPIKHENLARTAPGNKFANHRYKEVSKNLPQSKVDLLKLSDNLFNHFSYDKLKKVVIDFYKEQYRPENMELICIGDFGNEAECSKIRDYITHQFSMAKAEPVLDGVPTVYEEKVLPFEYNTSSFTDPELVDSYIMIIQNYLNKKVIKVDTDINNRIIISKDKKIFSKCLIEIFEDLIKNIHDEVITEKMTELYEQGLNGFFWTRKSRANSWQSTRTISFRCTDNKMEKTFNLALNTLWNLEGEIIQESVDLAKNKYKNELSRKYGKKDNIENRQLVNECLFRDSNPYFLFDSESEKKLKTYLLSIIKTEHLKMFFNERIALFNKEKISSLHILSYGSPKLSMPSGDISKQFLEFIDKEKSLPQPTVVRNTNIFEGINFEGQTWKNKTIYDTGLIEYNFSNHAKVILFPYDKSDQKEIRVEIGYNIWPYILNSNEPNDYINKYLFLYLFDLIEKGGLKNDKISSERKKSDIGFRVNLSNHEFGVALQLKKLENLEIMFKLFHFYCQGHLIWNLDSFEEMYLKIIENSADRQKRSQNDPNTLLNSLMCKLLYANSPLLFDLAKLKFEELTYSYFKEQMRLISENMPAPTIILSGYFEVEKVEALLEKYVGGMSFNQEVQAKQISSTTFPEGIQEKEFYCKGEEGRTQTAIIFPFPSIKDIHSDYQQGRVSHMLSNYLHDGMRFKGEQSIYSIGVETDYQSVNHSWNIPHIKFLLTYPTVEGKVVLDRFWAALNEFKNLPEEDENRIIEQIAIEEKKEDDFVLKDITYLHQRVYTSVKWDYSLNDDFFGGDASVEGIKGSIRLAQGLLQKDNYIRITMHTTQSELPEINPLAADLSN